MRLETALGVTSPFARSVCTREHLLTKALCIASTRRSHAVVRGAELQTLTQRSKYAEWHVLGRSSRRTGLMYTPGMACHEHHYARRR